MRFRFLHTVLFGTGRAGAAHDDTSLESLPSDPSARPTTDATVGIGGVRPRTRRVTMAVALSGAMLLSPQSCAPTTAPSAQPETLRAPAVRIVDAGPTAMTVSWTPVSSARSYDLVYAGTGLPGPTYVRRITGTSRTVTGLTARGSYEAQVRAVTRSGALPWSPAAAITLGAPATTAPATTAPATTSAPATTVAPVPATTVAPVPTTTAPAPATTAPATTPPVVAPGTGYRTVGRDIIGPSGAKFVPIGMNGVAAPSGVVPSSGWWSTNMTYMTGRSATFVAGGYNFLRLNGWHDDGSGWNGQQFIDGQLATIDEYTARGVVVMPANHEYTAEAGRTPPTPAVLQADSFFMSWYGQMLDEARTNPRVWVNPLNEPWQYSDIPGWVTTMNWLYGYARDRGYTGILVFDLPGWAQGIQYVNDPAIQGFMSGKSNVVLGFHNYDANAEPYKATPLPVIVAEAGVTLGNESRSSFDWSRANARTVGWGLVAWAGAMNRVNTYSFRTQTGAAFYETQVAESYLGQQMRLLAAGA